MSLILHFSKHLFCFKCLSLCQRFYVAGWLISCFLLMCLTICTHTHTHIHVCVRARLSLPGWILCNHSSVRSLWGMTVAFFLLLLLHPLSPPLPPPSCFHTVFNQTSFENKDKMNICLVCFTDEQISHSVSLAGWALQALCFLLRMSFILMWFHSVSSAVEMLDVTVKTQFTFRLLLIKKKPHHPYWEQLAAVFW